MKKNNHLLLVGTYTSGKSEGIYSFAFDPVTYDYILMDRVKTTDPSYIALSRCRGVLYSVTESAELPSYANTFNLDTQTGELTKKGRRSTKGAAPCYIATDPKCMFVVTANYAGGSISVFPIMEEGDLAPTSQLLEFTGNGVDKKRQEASHIHCTRFSPDGKYLFASDLGTDHIYRFEIDTQARTKFLREDSKQTFSVKGGSGPRHLIFDPSGEYMYLITELSVEVMVFTYGQGNLKLIQTLGISKTKGGKGGDVDITPNGKFLYASVRDKNDGVAMFAIDSESGKLKKIGFINTASHPRNITVSPDGKTLLVAAMNDNIIEIYEIDQTSGKLTNTEKSISVDTPTCMIFASFMENIENG